MEFLKILYNELLEREGYLKSLLSNKGMEVIDILIINSKIEEVELAVLRVQQLLLSDIKKN